MSLGKHSWPVSLLVTGYKSASHQPKGAVIRAVRKGGLCFSKLDCRPSHCLWPPGPRPTAHVPLVAVSADVPASGQGFCLPSGLASSSLFGCTPSPAKGSGLGALMSLSPACASLTGNQEARSRGLEEVPQSGHLALRRNLAEAVGPLALWSWIPSKLKSGSRKRTLLLSGVKCSGQGVGHLSRPEHSRPSDL